MTTRTRLAALVFAAAALALSACSGNPGSASPPPASADPSHATPPAAGSGAPKVTNPLPAGTIDRDPCSTLTASQVNTLLGTSAKGESEDTGIAKMCHWANRDRGSGISVQLVYAWNDGLGHVYAKKNEGFFKELAPVQGYPAAAYGPSDDRSTGRCGVAVGISDSMAFEADATISRSKVGQEGSDPCDAARRISDAVVTTLKGGA